MSATKPVVVAVDGSESASSAVVWAARTAVVLGRPLHIATVVHIPAFYYSEPYLAESFKDELRRTATARLDSAQILARQSIDDDLEIVTELLDGSVSDRLIELSKGAYIIALGPRGHGEFTGLVVGSATVSVVSHGESSGCSCPRSDARRSTADRGPRRRRCRWIRKQHRGSRARFRAGLRAGRHLDCRQRVERRECAALVGRHPRRPTVEQHPDG